MNTPKHIAGIALFILIVSVSAFIASIVAAPLHLIPPVPLPATAPQNVTLSQPVNYKVPLVSLDFINRKIYTTLTVKRERGTALPNKIWVFTSLFVPERPSASWSSLPVEVSNPFANGDELSLTLSGTCKWCNTEDQRNGYYANIGVSTVSADDAIQRAARMSKDIKTAIPVLVQVEQNSRR